MFMMHKLDETLQVVKEVLQRTTAGFLQLQKGVPEEIISQRW